MRKRTSKLCLVVLVALVAAMTSGAQVPGAASVGNSGVLPSDGCGSSTLRAGGATITTQSGGVARTYIRHVPPAHDGVTPNPLVLSLHGLGEGAVLHATTTQWNPRADEHGFVVAYAQGIDGRWDLGFEGRDVAFLTQVFDEIERDLCIDTNRVYVEGYSFGAFMTSTLSCVLADRIAAAAPLAGLVDMPACAPAKPVPVLTFHGTVDNWVPYGPIPGRVAGWAARNGCSAPPSETAVPGDDVVTITKFSYPCPEGAEVEFYSIENGGHAWPGSEFSRAIEAAVGYTTFALDATELMWDFFSAHQVDPNVATYTARFSPSQFAALARIAAARVSSVAEVVQAGVTALRGLADSGQAQPVEHPPNDGQEWVTLAYPLDEMADFEADAAASGATGDELVNAGGRLVNLIVYLAAVGRL